MTFHPINKTMKIEEIILSFPQKAQKLRRIMRNVLPCSDDLPNESLEGFLANQGKEALEIELFMKKLNDVLSEQADANSISLTEKAAIKFKELLSKEEKVDWGLKLADAPASCGTGFEYIMEISSQPDSGDIVFHSRGIKIYSPSLTIKRFIGSLIDFEENSVDDRHFTGLLKVGFNISNPNIKTTCACGCSNSYTEE